MYRISTEKSFDSAHFLAGYKGKCANIHGHRWRVIVTAEADELIAKGQSRGMVMDFSDLKKNLQKEVDRLDHTLIIEKNSLKNELFNLLQEENFKIVQVDFRPTAENFAKYFFDILNNDYTRIVKVEVFETPNNSACYEGER